MNTLLALLQDSEELRIRRVGQVIEIAAIVRRRSGLRSQTINFDMHALALSQIDFAAIETDRTLGNMRSSPDRIDTSTPIRVAEHASGAKAE